MDGLYTDSYHPHTSHMSNLFSQSQINSVLVAWLPTKLEPYLTGIMAVDMFITTALATGLTTLAFNLYRYLRKGVPWKNDKNVTLQIEYYNMGKYNVQYVNVFYEALSWLISQQTKKLDKGSFVMRTTNSPDDFIGGDDNELAPAPGFNILPEREQQITIEHNGKKFHVTFRMPEQEMINENSVQNNFGENRGPNVNAKKSIPSIYLTTTKDSNTDVDGISEFLNHVLQSYQEVQKKLKVRSRFERNESIWQNMHSLSSVNGLDSVAIDEPHEKLLKKELELFIDDKTFYERVGMPYRRGILLHGKPGTGKTSLINAISSHLSRDIYYLNLKNIIDDNELNAAFSDVPENQIIVLEDVDTQSKVLHKRKKNSKSSSSTGSSKSKDDDSSNFSLSTFLGCLDGQILAAGNIIIMTTNHLEYLDPACIRPGRMDVHLNLDYCTHYQIKKMFRSVVENFETEFPQDILEKIPEKLLPPCEVMMTMVLFRNEINLIPEKIYELVEKYEDMEPDDIARQLEEEEAYYDEKEETRLDEVNDESEWEEEEFNNNAIKNNRVNRMVRRPRGMNGPGGWNMQELFSFPGLGSRPARGGFRMQSRRPYRCRLNRR